MSTVGTCRSSHPEVFCKTGVLIIFIYLLLFFDIVFDFFWNTSGWFLPILKTESINITDIKIQWEPSLSILLSLKFVFILPL